MTARNEKKIFSSMKFDTICGCLIYNVHHLETLSQISTGKVNHLPFEINTASLQNTLLVNYGSKIQTTIQLLTEMFFILVQLKIKSLLFGNLHKGLKYIFYTFLHF